MSHRPTALFRILLVGGAVLASLVVATLLVAALETGLGVRDASATYLLAVVGLGVVLGTRAAVAGALGGFLLANVVFTDPRFTVAVADPGEWLELVLLLVVGVVVGQLAGLQRLRADAAEAREREARAVFGISHAIATSPDLDAAASLVLRGLVADAWMERAWIVLDDGGTAGPVLADSAPGTPLPGTASASVLRRMPGAEPAVWTRVHDGVRRAGDIAEGHIAYRVRMTDGDRVLASLWGMRRRDAPPPDRPQTRLLASAADQLASGLVRRRLATAAVDAEVARRSDAAKSALLDSVSHDLRTPLASIRAGAGSLMDPAITWDPEEARATAAAMDREAARLARLVSNLLDMSRIEAGMLMARLAAHDVGDLVEHTLERMRPALNPRRLEVCLPLDAPPVSVDELWLDQVLTNLLENVARHTPPDTAVRLDGSVVADGILLTLTDDGPGVPAASLPHLFEKFYRPPGTPRSGRGGSGIGLSVVRGLVEAMGGRITARGVEPHGLAIDLLLPSAGEPAMPGGSP